MSRHTYFFNIYFTVGLVGLILALISYYRIGKGKSYKALFALALILISIAGVFVYIEDHP